MRRKDLQEIKIKRILTYYAELERHRVSHCESLAFICYMFSVSERWVEELLRKYDLRRMHEITLQHNDVDIIAIDTFVKKLYKQALRERADQKKLF